MKFSKRDRARRRIIKALRKQRENPTPGVVGMIDITTEELGLKPDATKDEVLAAIRGIFNEALPDYEVVTDGAKVDELRDSYEGYAAPFDHEKEA